MWSSADHDATMISCANIRKAMSGMLLKASCVHACECEFECVCAHVCLVGMCCWKQNYCDLVRMTGLVQGRGTLCGPWCCVQPHGDAFWTPPLVPVSFMPQLPGQGYTGKEGRLLSIPDGNRQRDKPPWRGTGCQCCLSVPVSVKLVQMIRPMKNLTARGGVILQLALKKHSKSSSKT